MQYRKCLGQPKTGRPCDSTCVMYRAPVGTYKWFEQADLMVREGTPASPGFPTRVNTIIIHTSVSL